MEVLFIVSNERSARFLRLLAAACTRRGVTFGCFFTNDGVLALNSEQVLVATRNAAEAVACEMSWSKFAPEQRCPVTLGSQTQNSAMAAAASRVVSL